MAKKGLIITLITLGLVVVLPVVTVFGCLYVNDKTTVYVDEDFDIKKYGQYIASSSLDGVNNEESESYGKLDFAIDQLALNSLINAAVYKKNNSTSEESEEETTQNIKDQITKYVPSMYVLIKENEYVFKINAKFGFFKTQVVLYTKLSKTVNETDPRNSYFEFEIVNFTLGRIPKLDSLAKKLLTTFNLQDTIQNSLNDYGIHAEIDLANASIKYTYGNLLIDIQKLTNTLVDDKNIQLYFDVIDEFVERGILDFNFYKSEAFHIICNLETLSEGGNTSKNLNLDIDNQVKSNVEKLFNAGEIEENEIMPLFKFFFQGYDHVSDDIKNTVSEINFSCISPTFDCTTYQGFDVLHQFNSLESIIQEQMNEDTVQTLAKLQSGETFARLKENEIDDYIQSKDNLMGYSQLVQRIEDDKLICNYVTVDNFYTSVIQADDIDANTLEFVVGISVNGYEFNVVFKTIPVESTNNYEIVFDVNGVYLGSQEMKGSLTHSLLQILNGAVAGDSSISINIAESEDEIGTIVFDFESSIDDTYKTAIESYNRKLSYTLEKGDNDEGVINLYTVEK